ncbi:MAG: hypothetical protein ACKV0T_20235 [Planctomycetales bacterium]
MVGIRKGPRRALIRAFLVIILLTATRLLMAQESLTIAGVCRDEQGTPVPRVTVTLYRSPRGDIGRDERLREILSDAQGRYEFADLEPVSGGLQDWQWCYVVAATAQGMASHVAHLVEPEDWKGIDFQMQPAATLAGVVTDGKGQPIEGALVGVAGLGFRPLEGVSSARTGNDGRFAITDLAPSPTEQPRASSPRPAAGANDRLGLHIRHPAYALYRHANFQPPGPLSVRLAKGGSLRGKVVDQKSRKPAMGVLVLAIQANLAHNLRGQECLADDQGEYLFTSLPPGQYTVQAWSADRFSAPPGLIKVVADRESRALELQLVEGGWIEGRVLTVDNQPLGAESPSGNRPQVGLRTKQKSAVDTTRVCVVDAEGRFRLRVPSGTNFPCLVQGDLWDRTWRKEKYDEGISVDAGETVTVTFRILARKPPPPRPKRDPVVLPLPIEEERWAANEIRDLGGWYQLDPQGHVVEVNMVYHEDKGQRYDNRYTDCDEALRTAPSFPRLKRLYLHKGQATDVAMESLTQLQELEVFFVWDAIRLTDAGVGHLGHLERLESVHLSNSPIGDEALQVLSTLPNLRRMSMQQNHFSDAGLKYLANMSQLRSLWIGLGHGRITDEGIRSLEGLEDLQELDLQKTQVTPEGVAELQKALPKLQIIR